MTFSNSNIISLHQHIISLHQHIISLLKSLNGKTKYRLFILNLYKQTLIKGLSLLIVLNLFDD